MIGSKEVYIDLTAYKTYEELIMEINKEIKRLKNLDLDDDIIFKIIFLNQKFRNSVLYEQTYNQLYNKYKEILQL